MSKYIQSEMEVDQVNKWKEKINNSRRVRNSSNVVIVLNSLFGQKFQAVVLVEK